MINKYINPDAIENGSIGQEKLDFVVPVTAGSGSNSVIQSGDTTSSINWSHLSFTGPSEVAEGYEYTYSNNITDSSFFDNAISENVEIIPGVRLVSYNLENKTCVFSEPIFKAWNIIEYGQYTALPVVNKLMPITNPVIDTLTSSADATLSSASNASKAFGLGTSSENLGVAYGAFSHSEGNHGAVNKAGKHYNTPIVDSSLDPNGGYTGSFGIGSHTEGDRTLATYAASFGHAEGHQTVSDGFAAHSEGRNTTSMSNASHAEGDSGIAYGVASHIEGKSTKQYTNVYKFDSTQLVEYWQTGDAAKSFSVAWGDYSHVEGVNNLAKGIGSHVEGKGNQTLSSYSHAEGEDNTASGIVAHVEGKSNTASGDYSHVGGFGNTVEGDYSSAEGQGNTVSGTHSHAGGLTNTVSSDYSSAGGKNSVASNTYTFAYGNGAKATNQYATAFGRNIEANGLYCFAAGYGSVSNGAYNAVFGKNSIADGSYGVVCGDNLRTNNPQETAFGKYNISDDKTIFTIGYGKSDTTRTNLLTIHNDGKIYAGNVSESAQIATKGDVAAIVNGAPSTLDTLKEVADWIENDQSGAIAMQSDISDLKNNKVDKVAGKELSTNDYTDEDKATVDKLKDFDTSGVSGGVKQCILDVGEFLNGDYSYYEAIDEYCDATKELATTAILNNTPVIFNWANASNLVENYIKDYVVNTQNPSGEPYVTIYTSNISSQAHVILRGAYDGSDYWYGDKITLYSVVAIPWEYSDDWGWGWGELFFRLIIKGDNFDYCGWKYTIEPIGEDVNKALPAVLGDINLDPIQTDVNNIKLDVEALKASKNTPYNLVDVYENYIRALENACDYPYDYPWYGEDPIESVSFEKEYPVLHKFYHKAQNWLENFSTETMDVIISRSQLDEISAYKDWDFFGEEPLQLFTYNVPDSNLASLRDVCVQMHLTMGGTITAISGGYKLVWSGKFTHCGKEYKLTIDCGHALLSDQNKYINKKPGITYDYPVMSQEHVSLNITITQI